MTLIACSCKTCKADAVRPVQVPDTFAPGMDRKPMRHGLVFQANHPVLGAGFRAKTGITLA